MKITYVCNEYPPRPHGGIGTFYRRCAHAMVQAGHEATIVGIGGETALRHDNGVRVHLLRKHPIRALAQFGNRRRLHAWLRRYVAAEKIDIVQVPDFQGLLPFPLGDCPVAVRLHMTETIIAKNKGGRARHLFRRFERQTLNRHRNWIASSQSVLQRTIDTFGIQPNFSTVIFPLIKASPQAAVPDWLPEQFILYAGTVCRSKGAISLAEAARDLLDRYPALHLVYAGPIAKDGSRRIDQVIRSIVGTERERRTHFPGRLPHDLILSLMARARVFVFPSTLESFGQVVGEAMSTGCPTVTSAIEPFTEFITHDRNGLLVPPGRTDELSQAVDSILSDPALAARLSAAARQSMRQLQSESCFVQSTLEFYRACIDRKH